MDQCMFVNVRMGQEFVSLQKFGASYFLAKTAKNIVLLLKQRNTTVPRDDGEGFSLFGCHRPVYGSVLV